MKSSYPSIAWANVWVNVWRVVWAAALLALLPLSTVAQYRTALPGYRYEFPRDDFNHPEFQTEWWYYTGNLKSAAGREFGYELTFFRQAVARDPQNRSAWSVEDIYLAHLALTDIGGGTFYHRERLNRTGPGLAGVSQQKGQIWNGNWQVETHGNQQELRAISDDFALHFVLDTTKPRVTHGINGVSQKAEGPGRASHYISETRLSSTGTITLRGTPFQVTGTSWMDHEFFTQQLDANQVGWDWLSLQFADDTELMLFRIRRKDGSIDPFSSGTYVDRLGRAVHLRDSEFALLPVGGNWTSAATRATYPTEWEIRVPALALHLQIKTPLPQQEIVAGNQQGPSYWEGAIRIMGSRGSAPVSGVGYLEMTGYDRPVNMGR